MHATAKAPEKAIRHRVLLVVSDLGYGGAQRQVLELANNLDESQFDVSVCCLSNHVPLAKDLRLRADRLHVIKKGFKCDATVVPRLVGLIKRLRIDIIHSFLFDAEIAARLAGRLAGVGAVVGSERNTDYHLKWRQRAAYRLTRGCVDLIVANSEAGAGFNSRMLGHDMSLYRVVHNGVDVERFAPGDGGAVRRSLGIGEEERVVGMFAAFKPQKNHKMWIAAARRVLVRLPGTRLLFVGDVLDGGAAGSAEYKRRVGQLIDEVGLRPHCVFLGNRDAVAPLYAACDVTVLPSLHEGTPNVLLESMACGVPVVASNVSDNTYVVPNGRVGYLVPVGDGAALADRVCSLLADEDQRRAMGRAGRDWVRQEFSTAVLARRMEAVYSELLDRKRSACGRHNGGLAAS